VAVKAKVVAVVSAYNEEERITLTLDALRSVPRIDEIVVVDDASSDGTAQQASISQVKVISLERNLGKGGALNLVLGRISFDVLLLLDADLAESALQVDRLLKPVLEGRSDMAIADFPPARVRGGLGLVKSLAKWAIKNATGLSVREPLSGQRAMTKEVIEKVKRLEEGFGVEVGLTIDAARAGFRIIEIETEMTHRETGRDWRAILHRGRQFFDVLKVVLRRL
jgi:glycosyltransferase involved in cell wall biosynthesis